MSRQQSAAEHLAHGQLPFFRLGLTVAAAARGTRG
jgi:hypothetical protein